MKELFVARERLVDEQGRAAAFDYYVLVEEARLGETFSCENYGVRVAAADPAGPALSLPGITLSTRGIDELMELLVRGGVTPTTLRDVVEDWLAAERV